MGYRHSDHLGSSRFASTPNRLKYFDVAYAPYGEDYAGSGTVDLSFTGQKKDTALWLYDFMFRKYNAAHGRWMSPDPEGIGAANPGAPQSWNRYAYVNNSPLNSTDTLGLDVCLENDCNGSPGGNNSAAYGADWGPEGPWGDGSPWGTSSGYAIDGVEVSQQVAQAALSNRSNQIITSTQTVLLSDLFVLLDRPDGYVQVVTTTSVDPMKAIFAAAEDEALELLQNPKCKKAFKGQGAKRIKATSYTRQSASLYPQIANWAAVTTGPFSVQINSTGGFYSQTGRFPLKGNTYANISGGNMIGAFTLLHELLHQLTDSHILNAPIDGSTAGVIDSAQRANNSFVYDNCIAP